MDPTLREMGTFRFCSVSSVTSASDFEKPAASDCNFVVPWCETYEAVVTGSVAGRDSVAPVATFTSVNVAFATPAPLRS